MRICATEGTLSSPTRKLLPGPAPTNPPGGVPTRWTSSRFDADHPPQQVAQFDAVVRPERGQRVGREPQRPLEVAGQHGARGRGHDVLDPPVALVRPPLDESAR